MITNRLLGTPFTDRYELRNGKISSSGEFITTTIFSGRQLREAKMRWQATLTVIT
jgi:hypothetical protein